MNIEPDSQEQLYQYFLAEAPELLRTIEETLVSLIEEKTSEKVHTLMRSAHTLKGSAASVEQETIKTIAHHLEDVFQALYPPELELDSELGSLLLEGYECLCTPLNSTLSGISYDENLILEQTAEIFAQLQSKLGDFFGREAPLPTSEELGFDVVGSIFTDSIIEDLQQLEEVIIGQDSQQIEELLRSQTEFFLDLGVSYSLPGLAEIAQTILLAIEQNPDQIFSIAEIALENLHQARTVILAGERDRGGEVSAQLREWVQAKTNDAEGAVAIDVSSSEEASIRLEAHQITEDIPENTFTASTTLELDSSAPSEFTTVETEVEQNIETVISEKIIEQKSSQNSEQLVLNKPEEEKIKVFSDETALVTTSPIDRILQSIRVISEVSVATPQEKEAESSALSKSSSGKPVKSSSPTIRVAIEQLDRLNHSIGELFIKENQHNLQYDQLNNFVREALQEFRRCQQQLSQLSDWSDQQLRYSRSQQRRRNHPSKLVSTAATRTKSVSVSSVFNVAVSAPNSLTKGVDSFDALEMDVYSDLHLLLQNLTENMMDLGGRIESIERVLQQSYLNFGKRKQLLETAQEELFQARMIPIGTVLNRFPPLLKQIIATYGKPAELKLTGMEVTIDKAIAEKIYEPLLHLIRNAYDHGLEETDVRLQKGKSETGQILVHAYHQGNRTIIEVGDDGKGLDWEHIRTKAVENQLLSPSEAAKASEAQLADLLFEAGFSTAEKLTDLSGRGVGLDVVRSQIEALKGSVSLSSVFGQGTTFVMQLPLKVTTSRLLLCQSQDIVYALLSKEIDRVLLPVPEQIESQKSLTGASTQTFLRWQEGENQELIPIHSLGDFLNYEYPFFAQRDYSILSSVSRKKSNQVSPLLMVQTNNEKLCIQVEQILVEQELVIKSLDSIVSLPDYIQGYSVLGDGNLSLVIELVKLVGQIGKNNLTFSNSFAALPQKPILALKPANSFEQLPPVKAEIIEESGLFSLNHRNSPQNSLVAEKPKVLVIEDSVVQRQTRVLPFENAIASVRNLR